MLIRRLNVVFIIHVDGLLFALLKLELHSCNSQGVDTTRRALIAFLDFNSVVGRMEQ